MDNAVEGPGKGVGAAGEGCGELELQARWFSGEFGRDFMGTAGERVRIVHYGEWNRLEGPDFVEAVVEIDGGAPRRGAIELDLDARDWERHGHACNRDFEDTVLHVFARSGMQQFFSRTRSNRLVTQIRIQPESAGGRGAAVTARPGRCACALGALSKSQLREVLVEAGRFRFAQKASALGRVAAAHGVSEALFQAVSAGLGYPRNQMPFALLAQRLSAARLLRDAHQAEALLFGAAGFLPESDLRGLESGARRYVRGLWEEWWRHRAGYAMSVIPARAWRLSGQRPLNHPHRRVGALGVLVKHWRRVLRLAGERDWPGLKRLLEGLRHAFWSVHYTFQAPVRNGTQALIGRERVEELLINVFLPHAGDDALLEQMRSPEQNRRCRIAAERLLPRRADTRELLRDAICQQGILQLYRDFCVRDASDCVRCPFPEAVNRTVDLFGM